MSDGNIPVLQYDDGNRAWFLTDVGTNTGNSLDDIAIWDGRCYWTKDIKNNFVKRMIDGGHAWQDLHTWRVFILCVRDHLLHYGRFKVGELDVVEYRDG